MMFEVLKLSILAVFSAFTPVWYPAGEDPETPQERADRWTMIAEVVAEESHGDNVTPWGSRDDAALLLAVMRGESAFEYNVHAGRESHIGHADRGLARCMGQIHHVKSWWTEDEWRQLAGLDREATRRCVRAMLRIFEYHAVRCKFRRKIGKKNRWKAPLTHREGKKLIRAYGNGHCGFRTTKGMRLKAMLFRQIKREFWAAERQQQRQERQESEKVAQR